MPPEALSPAARCRAVGQDRGRVRPGRWPRGPARAGGPRPGRCRRPSAPRRLTATRPRAGAGDQTRQSWPERQNWPEADYDGDWYPEEPRWDSGFPETDPNLKYREPGPGMPGYRGSREHRYGGDRY